MRRFLGIVLVSAAVAAPLASRPQSPDPVVDVVELTGVIDRPLERYALARLEAAEREGATLVVFHLDAGGLLKVSGDDILPPLVRRIRDASVPVAVHVGPRAARARGGAVFLLEAAHVASIGLSARIGPAHPVDLGRPGRWSARRETDALQGLAAIRNRRPGDDGRTYGAQAAQDAGFVDVRVPGVADLLRELDGRTVTTRAGDVVLRLPERGTVVRFHQPGPIRRFLHALGHPALAYVLLLGGAMLVVFEVFQRGFGVAGATGILALGAAAYGITVLPVRAPGLVLVAAGIALYAWDVAIDALGLRTVLGTVALTAGSLLLLPPRAAPLRVAPWLVGLGVAASLVMYVPVMTVVRRARAPIAAEVRRDLVGEAGEVRSLLNPEGFVWVAGELWRARSEDGARMRVGEPVVVARVDGSLLIVRPGADRSPS